MRIGIDLLWVRVGICGGTESYIRNLLDGFAQYAAEQEYVLFVAKDNAASFQHYADSSSMTLCVCEVECANQIKRIIWENLYLDKMAQQEKVDVMFIPVYSKPMTHGSGIPYISVIHDLQAMHYPQYFSVAKRLFLKYTWWNTCRTANLVAATTDYTKEDLIAHYPHVKKKICTLPIAIISKDSGMPASYVEKYGVEAGKYFYCVSSMLPHKNLNTILKVMQTRKQQGKTEEKLVLSGVGGDKDKLYDFIKELDIEDIVVLTDFVSDKERDCLYENCCLFLFPSIFEGFGMPPIEALCKGKNVVMTDKTCLKEVTEGKAIYVEKPFDVAEWVQKIEYAQKKEPSVERFERYELENVVRQYIQNFHSEIFSAFR